MKKTLTITSLILAIVGVSIAKTEIIFATDASSQNSSQSSSGDGEGYDANKDKTTSSSKSGGNSSTSSGSASNSLSATCGLAGQSGNPLCESPKDSQSLLTMVISYLMYTAAVASLVFIIIGGIKYATSSGNPNSVSQAKKTILGAIFGLVIALLSLFVVSVVDKLVKEGAGQEASSSSSDSGSSSSISVSSVGPSSSIPAQN